MIIKTQKNGYINMDTFAGFGVRKHGTDFTVSAIKYQPEARDSVLILGNYPTHEEAAAALEKLMQHADAVKKAEFYGTEKGFRYVSTIFEMPKASTKASEDTKSYIINGVERKIPLDIVDEIRYHEMVEEGIRIAEKRNIVKTLKEIDPKWEPSDIFYCRLVNEIKSHVDFTPAEDKAIAFLIVKCQERKEERELRERKEWITDYLLKKASDVEQNDFMGEPDDAIPLYGKADFRKKMKRMTKDDIRNLYNKYKESDSTLREKEKQERDTVSEETAHNLITVKCIEEETEEENWHKVEVTLWSDRTEKAKEISKKTFSIYGSVDAILAFFLVEESALLSFMMTPDNGRLMIGE